MPDGEIKKILITGGSGFIGRNLMEQLGGSYRIIAPTHQELNLLDFKNVESFLALHSFDIVIHAANIGGKRNQVGLTHTFEDNYQMFLNLARNTHLYDRLIFLGSGAEYGKQQPIVRVRESDFGRVLPQDDYGRAKYAASEYITQHEQITNLRCFGVFGKYEDYQTRFISNAICRALYGLPIVIRQNVVFDYLYVNDLVKIVDYFIGHKPQGKFYNVGHGQGVDLVTLAQLVKAATAVTEEIVVKQPGLGKEYTCDNSLLKNELKDFKFSTFEQSIGELVHWYRENLITIDKNELGFDS